MTVTANPTRSRTAAAMPSASFRTGNLNPMAAATLIQTYEGIIPVTVPYPDATSCTGATSGRSDDGRQPDQQRAAFCGKDRRREVRPWPYRRAVLS